uniref:Protein rolling stone n=1 Tax=Ciona savignyi TaxID=51511 RepID=H2Y9M7_CIOSA
MFHQWGNNKVIFLVYRAIVFLYTLAWIIADLTVYYQPRYWIFLTNWVEVIGCLYFCLAFFLALYGYFASKQDIDREKGTNWGCGVVWILFNVSINAAVITDILFWALLSNGLSPAQLADPFNIHSHAINLVLLLIDLFVFSYPIRILHLIYPMGLGLVYTAFTLILHGARYTSAVYAVINWQTFPALAAGVCFGASLVAMPISHLLVFGLYKIRALIARKNGCMSQQGGDQSFEMGQTNMAYDN